MAQPLVLLSLEMPRGASLSSKAVLTAALPRDSMAGPKHPCRAKSSFRHSLPVIAFR